LELLEKYSIKYEKKPSNAVGYWQIGKVNFDSFNSDLKKLKLKEFIQEYKEQFSKKQ
jgi:hypothetical protein